MLVISHQKENVASISRLAHLFSKWEFFLWKAKAKKKRFYKMSVKFYYSTNIV